MRPSVRCAIIILFALGTVYVGHAQTMSIRGTLLKADGKPLQYTEIELVPVSSDELVDDKRLFAVSSMSGKFSFTAVPSGKYTLSINFDDNLNDSSPYRSFFYPSSSTRAGAEVIEVPNSSKYSGIVFRLPPPVPFRKINAKVLLPNGQPASAVWTLFFDIDLGRMTGARLQKLDKNGMFSFSAFDGKRYKIAAVIFDVDTADPFIPGLGVAADGDSGIFVLDSATRVIEIRLKKTRVDRSENSLVG